MAVEVQGTASPRDSLLTDPRFRAIVTQLVVVLGLAAFAIFIINNTLINLDRLGILLR